MPSQREKEIGALLANKVGANVTPETVEAWAVKQMLSKGLSYGSELLQYLVSEFPKSKDILQVCAQAYSELGEFFTFASTYEGDFQNCARDLGLLIRSKGTLPDLPNQKEEENAGSDFEPALD